MAMTLGRRVAVLMVALLMALMMASPAFAAPGLNGQGNENSQGIGRGVGGGQANPDQGKPKAKGGGTLNNPNLTGF